MTFEQIITGSQSLSQIKAFHTSPRTTPFGTFSTQNDGGSIELPEHSRGNNSDHSYVPIPVALNDDKVLFGIKLRTNGIHGLIGNIPFDHLALSIVRIQLTGQLTRFLQIIRKHETQSGIGIDQAAGRIDPGPQLKADLENSEFVPYLGNFHESQQPGTLGLVQPLEPGGDQDPVFIHQWHQVRNRAQSHKVQERPQIIILS